MFYRDAAKSEAAGFHLAADDFAACAERPHGVNEPRVHGIAVQRAAGLGKDVGISSRRGFDRHIRQRPDGRGGHKGRCIFALAEIGGDNFASVQLPVFASGGQISFLKNWSVAVNSPTKCELESGPAMK